MADRAQYRPAPLNSTRIEKAGENWTLVLVKDLRHSPEKVWQALTDPPQLREWAPFEAQSNLATAGATVKLTWVGTGHTIEARVTRADAPRLLECGDMRWELEPLDTGTRLTLWHKIDRRFISWGAAGWHIAFDVLEHLLSRAPIGRMAGPDAMNFEAWQRLTAEYAQQFGIPNPGWKSQPKPES